MSNNCGKVSENIGLDCDNPMIGGVDDLIVIMNRSDIQSFDRNVTNKNIIEQINFVSTSPQTKGFTVQGKNYSNDVNVELVKARYSEGYKHNVIVRIFNNSSDIKDQIEKLVKGEIVIGIKNNFRGASDEVTYEIHGANIGLQITALTKDQSDADTQGAWILTASTPDPLKEPHLPATFFKTDAATSKARFEALYS